MLPTATRIGGLGRVGESLPYLEEEVLHSLVALTTGFVDDI